MTLSRRLDVLTKRYPSRPERTPMLDVSALTPEEQVALLELVAKLEPAPTLPDSNPDLSPLSDAELEWLDGLAERITVKEKP